MLSIKEAQARVLNFNYKPGTKKLDIHRAAGLVLSRNVVSPVDIPCSDIAKIGGFALRAIDIKGADKNYPIRIKIYRKIPSNGHAKDFELEPGFCASVAAGMPIPQNSDCVVPRQAADVDNQDILVYSEFGSQANIIKKGGDISQGEIVFCAGRQIIPLDLGVIAQLNMGRVEVYLPPRVALVSFCSAGRLEKLRLDANAFMLQAMVGQIKAGCSKYFLKPENKRAVKDSLKKALHECDLLIITGDDFLNDILLGLELDLVFWKINQDPGGQMAFLAGGNKAAFLVGSSLDELLICFELYIRPLILKMMHIKNIYRSMVRAQALEEIKHMRDRAGFFMVTLEKREDKYFFRPTCSGGMLSSVKAAGGIVLLPENTAMLKAGQEADITLIN